MDPIPYLGTTAPISFALPTAEDIKNDQLLLSYLQSREDVFESDEGLKRRSDVTNKVSNIMKEWAKYLGQQKQLPEEIYQDGGGIQLKIFGSTRWETFDLKSD
jgi:poly(A) polymerase